MIGKTLVIRENKTVWELEIENAVLKLRDKKQVSYGKLTYQRFLISSTIFHTLLILEENPHVIF